METHDKRPASRLEVMSAGRRMSGPSCTAPTLIYRLLAPIRRRIGTCCAGLARPSQGIGDQNLSDRTVSARHPVVAGRPNLQRCHPDGDRLPSRRLHHGAYERRVPTHGRRLTGRSPLLAMVMFSAPLRSGHHRSQRATPDRQMAYGKNDCASSAVAPRSRDVP